jgi:hypothetical protein
MVVILAKLLNKYKIKTQSLKTGIYASLQFSLYNNVCLTSPTLGKIKEFYINLKIVENDRKTL